MSDGIGKALTLYCRYPEEMDEIYDNYEDKEYLSKVLGLNINDLEIIEGKWDVIYDHVEKDLLRLRGQCTNRLSPHFPSDCDFTSVRLRDVWSPKWWLVKNRLEIGLMIETENKSLVAYLWIWMKGGRNVEKFLREDVLLDKPVESSKGVAGGRTITIKRVNIDVPDGKVDLNSENIVSLLTGPFLGINRKKWKLACDKAGQNKLSI